MLAREGSPFKSLTSKAYIGRPAGPNEEPGWRGRAAKSGKHPMPPADSRRFYRRKTVKRFGKRTSFMKAWNERSSEFEPGHPPDFPSGYQGPKETPGAKFSRLILRIKTSQLAVRHSTKISRDFDVIRTVSGPLRERFLSI
jgi:hypothetical protein